MGNDDIYFLVNYWEVAWLGMFSESVADFGMHDICLYTDNIAAYYVITYGRKYPRIALFLSILFKNAHNFFGRGKHGGGAGLALRRGRGGACVYRVIIGWTI